MEKLELKLSTEGWRLFCARNADAAFESFKQKVFARDDHCCRYCGFQAKTYHEVVNLDGNYKNNKLSNMVTACVFCTQCLFVQSAGITKNGGGFLIQLPEMTQNQLNSLCHVLFCAITNDTGFRDYAKEIFRNLRHRSRPIEKKFGDGASEPNVFGGLLVERGFEGSERETEIFKDLRLLPSRVRFAKQIEHWAKAALDDLAG